MAPGTRIGDFGVPLDGARPRPRLRRRRRPSCARGSLGAEEAKARGALRSAVTDPSAPTLANMLVALDGVQYKGRTLDTAERRRSMQSRQRELDRPGPRSTSSSCCPASCTPWPARRSRTCCSTIGLGLLVFELFTAGVGVAGVVGAVCLVLGVLRRGRPARRGRGRWPAAARRFVALRRRRPDGRAPLLDRGRHRRRTSSRPCSSTTACPCRGSPCSSASAASSLAFLTGMPSMVRTRFATPTIGREWMIGELGEAVVAVDPDGVVLVRGAQWRARTNRATPIDAGADVRVVGHRRRHPRGRAGRGRGSRLPRAGDENAEGPRPEQDDS